MLGAGEEALRRAHLWPLRVVLEVPVVDFTVRTLMELRPGMVLETAAPYNEDVVLQVNGQVLGPAKFDVTGQTLAVRMTGVA
jgi:flagellar motor switch/type III secretory pathway protein FliN